MRRNSDLAPLAVIAVSACLALGGAGLLWRSWARFSVAWPLPSRPAGPTTIRTVGPQPGPQCVVPFRLSAQPSDWSVVGTYSGSAHLVPEGLEVDLTEGATLAAERDASVRELVFGVAEKTGGDGWTVVLSAPPIPIGSLQRGVARPTGPQRVVIPDVGPEELAQGWLVAEHVLDAPDAAGGTAWTYLHADPETLRPLLLMGCLGVP